ncbi:MAG TPA: septum formation initiator family protein [Patescibacteria group bacterium]|nr:septum formation initiator family protein [Patescibacteria group bacterium]
MARIRLSDPSSASRLRRLFDRRIILVVQIAMLTLLVFSFVREYVRQEELRREIRQLQEQALHLEGRQLALKDLWQTVQTETYLEQEARMKLGLSKPGERLVIIQDAPTGTSVSNKSDVSASPSASPEHGSDPVLANPIKWWYYFFRKSSFDTTHAYGRDQ